MLEQQAPGGPLADASARRVTGQRARFDGIGHSAALRHLEQRAEVTRWVVLVDHDPVGFDPGVGGEGREPPRPTHRQTRGTTAPGSECCENGWSTTEIPGPVCSAQFSGLPCCRPRRY